MVCSDMLTILDVIKKIWTLL